MESQLIFVINPGSTSTKVALYDGHTLLFKENIIHPYDELSQFPTVNSQLAFRLEPVMACLDEHGFRPEQLAIVMGRGGMFPPMRGGGYIVNDAMKQMIYEAKINQHASNLGALMADEVARIAGVSAYIYDAVSTDEFPAISKVTGLPEVERQSFCHALNSKEAARRYAESIGHRYEDLNLLVAHLGGGITVTAHHRGRIEDSLADDAGPFSPERSGSIPVLNVIDLCYSGKYTKEEMQHKIRGVGGLRGHLGTSDCQKIEAMIASGDEHARLVYDAMAFQIAKGICNILPILESEVDAIIITGGIAHSEYITDRVTKYVRIIAPVVIMPGEFEMEALADGGYRILHGEETYSL